mmetsp:Transcript_7293/g.26624  ORF Transcript_7293/g.26624 Transcript_7293/m.26624 type:complete len:203 (-) Transcript_7293:179-787(-)
MYTCIFGGTPVTLTTRCGRIHASRMSDTFLLPFAATKRSTISGAVCLSSSSRIHALCACDLPFQCTKNSADLLRFTRQANTSSISLPESIASRSDTAAAACTCACASTTLGTGIAGRVFRVLASISTRPSAYRVPSSDPLDAPLDPFPRPRAPPPPPPSPFSIVALGTCSIFCRFVIALRVFTRALVVNLVFFPPSRALVAR